MSRVFEPVHRATAIVIAHTTHEKYESARRSVVERTKNLVHAQRRIPDVNETDSRMRHEGRLEATTGCA